MENDKIIGRWKMTKYLRDGRIPSKNFTEMKETNN
jgi:hypothetical protein